MLIDDYYSLNFPAKKDRIFWRCFQKAQRIIIVTVRFTSSMLLDASDNNDSIVFFFAVQVGFRIISCIRHTVV